MRELPKPVFVTVDPAATEADLIARYEAKSGKTLYPAQIERLFIDQIAYATTGVQMSIQNAGEQLLVRYANGAILDYLGDLVATPRQLAVAARCTLRFTVATPATQPLLVPVGTRVATQDAKWAFVTDEDVLIPAGQTEAMVTATCATVGEAGNGWAVGQISVIANPPFADVVATNTVVSFDGAEDEGDDRYRERIILAPEAYSNAGSRGAYRYHAMAVHQSIIDVAVHGPAEGQQPGHVALYPLTTSGLPSEDLLQRVLTLVNGEKVRPLCDTVHAWAPTQVGYSINARIVFFNSADRVTTMAAAQKAANAYVLDLRAGLGVDIVPEQLTARLQVAGVYRAFVEQPVAPRELLGNEWAVCSSIQLIDAGTSNG
ncbi:baseplate assembly protein [Pseudomonas lactis]|uniref:baseplate assembly protein n=1 Tax=Pseudomonas lactis TaxID=1615674 RepID=UPI001909584C|nr:baseplate J/gp47 family protein [Pseudomonas lactis]MBK3440806.1 baseplate J/gp47 family protein [Pseudomonas lactis]